MPLCVALANRVSSDCQWLVTSLTYEEVGLYPAYNDCHLTFDHVMILHTITSFHGTL